MINNQSSIKNPILSLDPSSTVIGFAVMSPAGGLVEGGLITPASGSDPSFDRISSMGHDLFELLDEVRPGTILIEWTVGKVGQRRHKGGGAGLSIYGAGVGWAGAVCRIWAESRLAGCEKFRSCPEKKTCEQAQHYEVIPILENAWTRGVPKKDRQIAIAAELPNYNMDLDPGGDLADAIGMAQWWLLENRIRPKNNSQ